MASADQPMPSVTLGQLTALGDEIAALVRAGVPLEQGLRRLAEEMPGKGGRAAGLLAQAMERGTSLPEILAQNPAVFPPVYRAIVEAGLESGRLAAALEAVAGSARRLADTRRFVALGFIYPVILFLLAWGLFAYFTVATAKPLLGLLLATEDPAFAVRAGAVVMTGLVRAGESAAVWGPAVPLVVLVLAGAWWRWSGSSGALESRAADRCFGWLPWVGPMLRSLRIATLADLLGMLLEHAVALDRAVVLASETVGSPRLCRAAQQIADSLRRGRPAGEVVAATGELPPLLAWLIVAGQRRGSMAEAMRHAAEVYHTRARQQAESARRALPVLLTLVIGGGVTLMYALLVVGTWFSLLRTLGSA